MGTHVVPARFVVQPKQQAPKQQGLADLKPATTGHNPTAGASVVRSSLRTKVPPRQMNPLRVVRTGFTEAQMMPRTLIFVMQTEQHSDSGCSGLERVGMAADRDQSHAKSGKAGDSSEVDVSFFVY